MLDTKPWSHKENAKLDDVKMKKLCIEIISINKTTNFIFLFEKKIIFWKKNYFQYIYIEKTLRNYQEKKLSIEKWAKNVTVLEKEM